MNYGRHSKRLAKIAESNPFIEEYYHEGDSGHWMHTVPGYIFTDTECGTLHCDTAREMRDGIKSLEKGIYKNGHSLPIDRNEYHTLVGIEKGGIEIYEILWGDYDKQLVKEEKQEYQDQGEYKRLKIITTAEDQASIEAAVQELDQ